MGLIGRESVAEFTLRAVVAGIVLGGEGRWILATAAGTRAPPATPVPVPPLARSHSFPCRAMHRDA